MLKVAPECISAMLESEADAPTQNKWMIQAVNMENKLETKYFGVALQVRDYFILFIVIFFLKNYFHNRVEMVAAEKKVTKQL